jgi:hypothetical protein
MFYSKYQGLHFISSYWSDKLMYIVKPVVNKGSNALIIAKYYLLMFYDYLSNQEHDITHI